VLPILFAAGTAVAAPFLTCDPYPASDEISGFSLQFDGGAWINILPHTLPDGKVTIMYDLAGLPVGAHVVKAKARNLWAESGESAPFAFTKSGTPKVPGVLRISP